jgi:aryl-alcohol dehydrogenase-like predicted oxidoreductase
VVTAPVIGASRRGHLEDAESALHLELTPEEIVRLEDPYTPRNVAGFS